MTGYEKRLDELESQVTGILREIDALRDALRKPAPRQEDADRRFSERASYAPPRSSSLGRKR